MHATDRRTHRRTDARPLHRPGSTYYAGTAKMFSVTNRENSKTLNINYRSNTSLKWLEFTLCRASRPRRIFTVFVRKRLLTYLRIYSLNVNLTGTKEALSVFCHVSHKATSVRFQLKQSSLVWYQYEGRSINKLQNGAVSLFLKLSKIRNIPHVAKCILEHPERIW